MIEAGRPTIDKEVEDLVVRMAHENRSWGYDRIVGALANLGYTISDQTVGNILKRHGLPPAPERKTTTTWKEFIRFITSGIIRARATCSSFRWSAQPHSGKAQYSAANGSGASSNTTSVKPHEAVPLQGGVSVRAVA